MDPQVVAALLAAGVSLIVGAATVLIAARSQKNQFQHERDRFEHERERQRQEFTTERERQQDLFASERERQSFDLKRRMTDRLYERRIAVYPKLFAVTAEFRRSVMKAAPDLAEHLCGAMSRVDKWHAGEGGLLLSGEAHQALLDLRNAVKAITEQSLASDALETATTHLWTCKNRLRRALRADVILLFEESETSTSRSSGLPDVRTSISG